MPSFSISSLSCVRTVPKTFMYMTGLGVRTCKCLIFGNTGKNYDVFTATKEETFFHLILRVPSFHGSIVHIFEPLSQQVRPVQDRTREFPEIRIFRVIFDGAR